MSSSTLMTPVVVAPVRPSLLLGIWSLTVREVVRFLRQRSRVMGAFVQPILFWVMFGAGLSGSFSSGGQAGASYLEFFTPGIAAMIVLFTSIFSAISVIQDRNEGFLQGVLVAPVSRTAIVMGKLCGGMVLSVGQALLFLGIAVALKLSGVAPQLTFPTSPFVWMEIIGMLCLMGLSLCGLGYAFAWRLDSVQGFHAIMSVLLFPMWLLSGAFFPLKEGNWLTYLMYCNPLTYAVAGLRHLMVQSPEALKALPPLSLCLAVSIGFAVAVITLDVVMTHKVKV
ncbi:MAG: ABC transporter permease [Planctomycetaceae bacterium]